MAQVSVETGHVAVMVMLCPYVLGFGEIERVVVVVRAPKVAVGITPDGG